MWIRAMAALCGVGAVGAAIGGLVVRDVGEAQLREWRVPWQDSRPRDPQVDAKGRVWFAGQMGDYLAFLEPQTRSFERFDLEKRTGPHSVVVADDGTVWFTGNGAGYIGRLDPTTGAVEKIPMPDPAASDPHTLAFGAGDDIWFTVEFGDFVGRLATQTRSVELIPVPTLQARPYGIAVDPQGRPWFAEFGSHKLGTVDPESMRIEEIVLPRENARPRRLAFTSDGAVWYVDYAKGRLGRYDPQTRKVEEWPVPGGSDARPYGMTVDDEDRLWFVETGLTPNRFVGFDPDSGEFTSEVAIESGGGSVRNMFFHAPTDTVWFGTDANTIGRARLP